jgi:hypothetical protein
VGFWAVVEAAAGSQIFAFKKKIFIPKNKLSFMA